MVDAAGPVLPRSVLRQPAPMFHCLSHPVVDPGECAGAVDGRAAETASASSPWLAHALRCDARANVTTPERPAGAGQPLVGHPVTTGMRGPGRFLLPAVLRFSCIG